MTREVLVGVDVAIVVGHDANSQGAVAVDGVSEWLWNRPLAAQVRAELEALGHTSDVHFRPQFGSYSAKMHELVGQIDAAAACAIELHFNSIDTTKLAPEKLPRHTTVVHWPLSLRGAELAVAIAPRVAEAIALGRTCRTRPQAESWSGAPLLFLELTKCPAVIIEPHFGCTRDDHQASTAARDDGRLARAIALGLDNFLRSRR